MVQISLAVSDLKRSKNQNSKICARASRTGGETGASRIVRHKVGARSRRSSSRVRINGANAATKGLSGSRSSHAGRNCSKVDRRKQRVGVLDATG